MSEESAPQAAFLGFAERATQVRDAGTDLVKWNVLGFKSILLTHFFPCLLNGWHFAFAMRVTGACKGKIRFKADSGEDIGSFDVELRAATPELPLTHSASPFLWYIPQAWTVFFHGIPAQPGIAIPKQGRYVTAFESADNEKIIGEFYCALVEPLPPTPERLAAMKSDPGAAKAVRAVFGCNFCTSKCQVYTAFERMPELEAEGFVWYQEIPEHFTCECGKAQIDLSTVRRNFFTVLGQRVLASGELNYTSLYERSALENLNIEFTRLVDARPSEESLQNFIEGNPVLLHQFPAEKIFFKPPILTRYKADFAIVTPQKELVLIEIERPSKRLLRDDGVQHAELTQAIGQVQCWLHEANEHRQALLDSLGIARETVSRVRGVVIAGRDAGNDASQLRRLKGSDLGQVTLLTYDDVAASLAKLAQTISAL